MIGGVRRVQYEDSDEAWERDIEVDDGEIRFVEALRNDAGGDWQVAASVMEFVREEPLVGELRRRIAAALRSVEGVETTDEMDTEVWLVSGTPSVAGRVVVTLQATDGTFSSGAVTFDWTVKKARRT